MKTIFTFGESMGLVQGVEVNAFSNLHEAKISTGGSEANVAIGLSRLGLGVTWFSRLGLDSVGDRVIKDLLGERVTVLVKQDEVSSTGLMLKTTPRKGLTSVSYYRSGSAASFISPSDFDDINFSNYDLVHLTGITPALSSSCLKSALHVASAAKKANCLVSFDVNYRKKLWSQEDAAPVLRELVSKSDIVIAGIDEAELVTNSEGVELELLAKRLGDLGPSIVVIKQGELGASLFQGGKMTFCPAIQIDVVDTVGAGDAFSAAFIGTFLVQNDAEYSLSKAVIAGGLACAHPGDWQGFPTKSELFNKQTKDPVSR